jgi:hypothetical protein
MPGKEIKGRSKELCYKDGSLKPYQQIIKDYQI